MAPKITGWMSYRENRAGADPDHQRREQRPTVANLARIECEEEFQDVIDEAFESKTSLAILANLVY